MFCSIHSTDGDHYYYYRTARDIQAINKMKWNEINMKKNKDVNDDDPGTIYITKCWFQMKNKKILLYYGHWWNDDLIQHVSSKNHFFYLAASISFSNQFDLDAVVCCIILQQKTKIDKFLFKSYIYTD